MYIYYPSCNFSIASPSTAKVVRNLLKEKMVVAGCCLRDQREIHEDDIGVYFCQHCRETIENKVKTMINRCFNNSLIYFQKKESNFFCNKRVYKS